MISGTPFENGKCWIVGIAAGSVPPEVTQSAKLPIYVLKQVHCFRRDSDQEIVAETQPQRKHQLKLVESLVRTAQGTLKVSKKRVHLTKFYKV